MASKKGRPSKYTAELAKHICDELAKGKSLRSICQGPEMPSDTAVRNWAREDVGGFSSQYAKARDLGLEAMAEETIEIADDGSNDTYTKDGEEVTNHDVIQRSRLRVDTRKWYLSKIAPKRYGDRVATEVSGPDGGPIETATRVTVYVPDNQR